MSASDHTDGSLWLPVSGASGTGDVDAIFYFIFWVALFFFLLITSLLILFVYKYRRSSGREAEETAKADFSLELTWSVIPLILLIITFYMGLKSFINMTTPPSNAYEIQVTGQKWSWIFTYPNGYVDENLHVPTGKPILLTMTSEDVIHSLYIPAFRIKNDVVPGRYSKLWFEANRVGEYDLFCAEYCGEGHSTMRANVIVHEPHKFHQWLENAGNYLETMSPAEAGQRIYRSRGCAQCHTIDGSANIGPTFKDVFGHKVALQSGETITVDENYIRESVLEPQSKVVAGFDPVMPTFKGRLKDKEITSLIEFIKSLSNTGGASYDRETDNKSDEGDTDSESIDKENENESN